MINPWEDTSILDVANSNLTNYTIFEDGFKSDGLISTNHENVFTKPTYFLDNVYFSSNIYANIQPDPFFNDSIEVMSNIIVHGKLFGSSYPYETNTNYIEFNSSNIDIGNQLIINLHSNNTVVKNNLNSSNLIVDNKSTLFGETNLYDVMRLHRANNGGYWSIYCDESNIKPTNTCDLVFKSRNEVSTTFTDTFDPSIINFTGQHRCTGKFNKFDIEDMVGKIVISTGKYSDLNNNGSISINEAIPIVALCKKEKDKRAFGVISDKETDDYEREFNLGQLKFKMKKKKNNKKYMINSVGEGGIWVCALNGNLENGDLITTSVLNGYGMKQTEDHCMNYTVAKITCDCDFDNLPSSVVIKEINYKKHIIKAAFVGCVYKF